MNASDDPAGGSPDDRSRGEGRARAQLRRRAEVMLEGALGHGPIPDDDPAWRHLRRWLVYWGERMNDRRRQDGLPIIMGAREAARQAVREVRGFYRRGRLGTPAELLEEAESLLRHLLNPSARAARDLALARFRQARATAGQAGLALAGRTQLDPHTRSRVEQALDEGFRYLGLYLFLRAMVRVKVEPLPLNLADVDEAVITTVRRVRGRVDSGRVEEPAHIVSLSATILLSGNRAWRELHAFGTPHRDAAASPTQAEGGGVGSAPAAGRVIPPLLWQLAVRQWRRREESINQPLPGDAEGQARRLADTLRNGAPQPDRLALVRDRVEAWDRELDGLTKDPELAQHPRKRLMLKALRLWLRWCVLKGPCLDAFEAALPELAGTGEDREAAMDAAISRLPLTVVFEGADLQGFDARLCHKARERFVLDRQAAAFLQKVVGASQNTTKVELDRVVPLLEERRRRAQLEDIFGIREFAAAKRRAGGQGSAEEAGA